MSRTKIAKNAVANLARGGTGTLVALILPPFLTKILAKDAYATWLLILQLSTYVSFLDFSIQLGVSRFVAHYTELGDLNKRDGIVSSAVLLLSGLSIVGIMGISALAWELPHLFKDMPSSLQQDAQLSLLLVGNSLAIGLPFSAFAGVFVGLNRYDIPAWIIGTTKLIGGVTVVLVANASHNLIWMAIVMATANIWTGVWLLLAQKKLANRIILSIQLVSKQIILELLDYCLGFSTWTIGLILVNGLDTAIIGFFDYGSLIYYSLAVTISNLVVGVQGTIISVIMPTAAAIGSRQDKEKLGKLLIDSTRYGTILIILTSLPILLFNKWIVSLWLGVEYVNNVSPILSLLILGNSIRYLGSPYATIVAAIGDQKLIVISPIIEGIVNLSVSILLVRYIGTIGVAIGTIVGGCISVVNHFMYNLPRTKSIEIESSQSLWRAVSKPLTSAIPSLIVIVYINNIKIETLSIFDALISFVSLLLTIIVLLFLETSSLERQYLLSIIKNRWGRKE